MHQSAVRISEKRTLLETVRTEPHVLVHPRMAWMLFYQQKKSVRKVCERFGISRKTFYKWWNRYQTSGYDPSSLQDESRRPHHSPHATPEEVVERIVSAKAETGYGQRRLKSYLKSHHNIILSEHTIWKLLRRHYGEDNLSVGKQNGNGSPHERPGDIVQVAFMKIEALKEENTLVQYTAIDLGTRLRISKIYERHASVSATEFLKLIIEKFPFAIRELQTPDDKAFTNGSPTMGVGAILFEPFRVILHRSNIAHTVLKDAEVKSSVAAKAMEIDLREYYENQMYENVAELTKELMNHTNLWNNHRKCESHHGTTPLQRLRSFSEYKHIAYFDPFSE